MTRKKKLKAESVPQQVSANPIISSVRVAEVHTKHGTFYQLVRLDTQDGKILGAVKLHDYFDNLGDIVNRADEIASAVQLPILTIDYLTPRN